MRCTQRLCNACCVIALLGNWPTATTRLPSRRLCLSCCDRPSPPSDPIAMKTLAAIALGSNLDSSFGDREANLREALRRLAEFGELRAVSAFYDTDPVGNVDQPRF